MNFSSSNNSGPLSAGQLNRRISFQKKVETRDESTGGILYNWVGVNELDSIPAQKMPISISAFIQSSQMQSKVTTRFKIRKLNGIKPEMRIVDIRDGAIYSIEGFMPDPRTGEEWLIILAGSGVSDG